MPELSWDQPCCERCWIYRIGRTDDGEIRRPVRVAGRDPVVEQCAFCGMLTIMGIYVRHDPREVPYPSTANDEDAPHD